MDPLVLTVRSKVHYVNYNLCNSLLSYVIVFTFSQNVCKEGTHLCSVDHGSFAEYGVVLRVLPPAL